VENLPIQQARRLPVDGKPGNMALLVTHLGPAYNLARWLLRNETEAEDAVQEAYLRAFHHIKSFRGDDSQAWFLTIVRNSCYDRLKQSARGVHQSLDEDTNLACQNTINPELSLLRQEEIDSLRRSLEDLPSNLREVLVLREFEEMSYRQIATAVEIPVGTVMSRLSRARQQLQQIVFAEDGGNRSHEFARLEDPAYQR
jgi:RNA polymerase sigma-70 factor, ECF subfamily